MSKILSDKDLVSVVVSGRKKFSDADIETAIAYKKANPKMSLDAVARLHGMTAQTLGVRIKKMIKARGLEAEVKKQSK